MGQIRVVGQEDAKWMTARDPSAVRGEDGLDLIEATDDEVGAIRFLHPGSNVELQMFEVRLTPNTEVESHAHSEDEIIYVLGGALHLGARVLGPGGSVFISGSTLYGFRAGPEGLHFLNFRAHQDFTNMSKEEFMAHRAKTGRTAERG